MSSATTATPTTHDWHRTQAKLANATRNGRPDEEVESLRRQFRFERLAGHVREAVETAPSLTPQQRSDIADMLVGGDR